MLLKGPDAVGVNDVSEELEFGGEKLGLGQVDCQAGLAQVLKNFLQVSAVLLLGF